MIQNKVYQVWADLSSRAPADKNMSRDTIKTKEWRTLHGHGGANIWRRQTFGAVRGEVVLSCNGKPTSLNRFEWSGSKTTWRKSSIMCWFVRLVWHKTVRFIVPLAFRHHKTTSWQVNQVDVQFIKLLLHSRIYKYYSLYYSVLLWHELYTFCIIML